MIWKCAKCQSDEYMFDKFSKCEAHMAQFHPNEDGEWIVMEL